MDNCKTCECHDFLDAKGSGIYGDYRDRGHWCVYTFTIQYPHEGKGSIRDEKYMSYKEFTKTPEWCPKNQKIYVTEGIECPILEIKSGIFKL